MFGTDAGMFARDQKPSPGAYVNCLADVSSDLAGCRPRSIGLPAVIMGKLGIIGKALNLGVVLALDAPANWDRGERQLIFSHCMNRMGIGLSNASHRDVCRKRARTRILLGDDSKESGEQWMSKGAEQNEVPGTMCVARGFFRAVCLAEGLDVVFDSFPATLEGE